MSEFALAGVKRSRRSGARSHDAGTLRLVWLVIALAIAASIVVARECSVGRFATQGAWELVGIGVFACGVALRWWAILVLGRFFTVDVAIHADHELVTRGPYRVLRHPSYTGALLAVAGMGVLYGSWPALVVLLVPVVAVMLVRIAVEERALAAAFGESWRAQCARTWRLVPGVW